MNRSSLPVALAVVAAVLALAVGAATLDAADVTGPEPGAGEPPAAPPAGGGQASGDGDIVAAGSGDCTFLCSVPVSGVPVPDLGGSSSALLALLVAGAAVAALVAYRATGGDVDALDGDAGADEADAVVSPATGPSPDPAPDQPPATNEVYRAWRAFADRLDAPSSRSPAEVADRAVDAGLDRDAVAALTGTFRAVRYGGRPATDDREARAASALERLDPDDRAGGAS